MFNTDDGKYHTAAQHEHQVQPHHQHVDGQRGNGIDQSGGNGGVGALPLKDISRQTLGKEIHGHPQDLPHVFRVSHCGHFAVDLQCVDRLDPERSHLGSSQKDHQSEEGIQKIPVFPGQKPVHKETGEPGIDDPEQAADQRRKQNKSGCRAGAPQTLLCIFKDAFLFPGRLKPFAGRDLKTDAREGAVQLFERDPDPAPGRIIDPGIFAADPGQDHKVIEIPVQDTGQNDPVLQTFRIAAESLGIKTIAPGSHEHVFRVGTVAGNAAVIPHLFQRDPFSVISHHHGKRSRAAFQSLHLHDDRNASEGLRSMDGILVLCHGPSLS